MKYFNSTKALNEFEKNQVAKMEEYLNYINGRLDVYKRVWFAKLFRNGVVVIKQRGENKSIVHVFTAKNLDIAEKFLKTKEARFLAGYREIPNDISEEQLNKINATNNPRVKSTVGKEAEYKTHKEEFVSRQQRLKKFW